MIAFDKLSLKTFHQEDSSYGGSERKIFERRIAAIHHNLAKWKKACLINSLICFGKENGLRSSLKSDMRWIKSFKKQLKESFKENMSGIRETLAHLPYLKKRIIGCSKELERSLNLGASSGSSPLKEKKGRLPKRKTLLGFKIGREASTERRKKLDPKTFIDKIMSAESYQQMESACMSEWEDIFPKEFSELRNLVEDFKRFSRSKNHPVSWKRLKEKNKSDYKYLDILNRKRCEIINKVEDISIKLQEPTENLGSWSATGTPGCHSDIDTVFFPSPSETRERSVFIKCSFDILIHGFFGAFSGYVLDAESYVSFIRQSEEKRFHTDAGKTKLLEIDFTGAFLQYYIQNRNKTSSFYETLEKFPNELKEPWNKAKFLWQEIKPLFPTTEDAHELIAKKRLDRMKTLLEWARQEDASLMKIENLNKRLKIAGRQKVFPFPSKKGGKIKILIDEELNKLALLSVKENSLYDEGYLNLSTFKHVCDSYRGQMYERRAEKQQKELSLAGRAYREEKRSIKIFYPSFNELGDKAEPPSFRQHLSSALENFHMLKGHAKDYSFEDFVRISKYAERTLDSCRVILKNLENNQDLLTEEDKKEVQRGNDMAEALSQDISDLEICKRNQYITAEKAYKEVLSLSPLKKQEKKKLKESLEKTKKEIRITLQSEMEAEDMKNFIESGIPPEESDKTKETCSHIITAFLGMKLNERLDRSLPQKELKETIDRCNRESKEEMKRKITNGKKTIDRLGSLALTCAAIGSKLAI